MLKKLRFPREKSEIQYLWNFFMYTYLEIVSPLWFSVEFIVTLHFLYHNIFFNIPSFFHSTVSNVWMDRNLLFVF